MKSLLEEIEYGERDKVHGVLAEHLRAYGWHCCENDAELRDLALSETDLMEPGDDE